MGSLSSGARRLDPGVVRVDVGNADGEAAVRHGGVTWGDDDVGTKVRQRRRNRSRMQQIDIRSLRTAENDVVVPCCGFPQRPGDLPLPADDI